MRSTTYMSKYYAHHFNLPINKQNPLSSLKKYQKLPNECEQIKYIREVDPDSEAPSASNLYDAFSKMDHYGGITLALMAAQHELIWNRCLAAFYFSILSMTACTQHLRKTTFYSEIDAKSDIINLDRLAIEIKKASRCFSPRG